MNRLKECFKKLKVLVVGDLMVDKYISGDVNRISPEAPVPVVEVNKSYSTLGGAANVANNLVSIGNNPILCGIIGNDNDGVLLSRLVDNQGISTRGIKVDMNRLTTTKTRVMSNGHQIVRYDKENKDPYKGNKIIDFLKTLKNIDAVIISDYGKGVVTEELLTYIYENVNHQCVVVDPNINNYKYYEGKITAITPNLSEAMAFHNNDEKLSCSCTNTSIYMSKKLKCPYVLITKGKDGMFVYDRDDRTIIYNIKATAKNVFDVSGAGDTVTSIFTLGLATGMSAYDAAKMANGAAGFVVSDIGTSVVGNRLWERIY